MMIRSNSNLKSSEDHLQEKSITTSKTWQASESWLEGHPSATFESMTSYFLRAKQASLSTRKSLNGSSQMGLTTSRARTAPGSTSMRILKCIQAWFSRPTKLFLMSILQVRQHLELESKQTAYHNVFFCNYLYFDYASLLHFAIYSLKT